MFAWGRQLTPNGGEKRGYYDFFPNGVPGSCHDVVHTQVDSKTVQ